MVAVRQFDEEAVLDRMMTVFWHQGYEATSIDDLVAATGVKRGSLYNAFGDKALMFLKAFDRHEQQYEAPILAALEEPDVRVAMRTMFDHMLTELQTNRTPPGCFTANLLGEATCRGDVVGDAVRDRVRRGEEALYARLDQARAEGQLTPDRDVRALARFFSAVLRVMPLMHRASGDAGVAADIANVAMGALGRQERGW